MNADHFSDVNVFWGSEKSQLPDPQGLAQYWYQVKAQVGNCHPGVCLPFGMVSAVAYSGGYPTGYGTYLPNSFGRPAEFLSQKACCGFTHFQVSGTGAIQRYYNYIRVVPLSGGLDTLDTMHPLREEKAVPGFYRTMLGDTGILAELTASEKSILHRYSFPNNSPALAVDLLQSGLAMKEYDKNRILEVSVTKRSNSCLDVYLGCEIPIFACLKFSNGQITVLLDGEPVQDSAELGDTAGHQLLILWQGKGTVAAELQAAFSLRSPEQAFHNLDLHHTFEQIAAIAADAWRVALSHCQVSFDCPSNTRIFYSALYHTLVKPSNFKGESPFWKIKPDYFVDFATLWDQYKTQLPLVLSLYSDIGTGIVQALLNMGERLGHFPNKILLSSENGFDSQQAVSLAVYVIADAYWRSLPGIDWDRALRIVESDLSWQYRSIQNTDHITHIWDFAEACTSAAKVAEDLGKMNLQQKFQQWAQVWNLAFDPQTGLIRDGNFYEGHKKTYSFRLMHDMKSRIARYPSREKLMADLDSFFGFSGDPAPQNFDGVSGKENEQRAQMYQRFEGLNNEPDMEVPYFYTYMGQHDKTVQILHDAMQFMFGEGNGGLPGNNDSGGLSAWYIWNAIGIFPVTGQNLMLIGSPTVNQSSIRLSSGNVFFITVSRDSEKSIYVTDIVWNGVPLSRKWLTVREFMQGGRLELTMRDQPQNEDQWILPNQ
ncbi:MAG: glycoside hydrolase domain-containing protein [Candidatus Merdivicinus sp.]|jgi:putative alpha-1,2-mannosidase